jgi:signal transduction histidine kinase
LRVTEEALRQAQKMEAVGQLTGGIAHDFNNMLAVIMGSLRLAQRRMERGDFNIQDYITGALGGAERAANLVARLLAFSRQQPLSPQQTDANRLLSGMEEVLRRTIPESIRMEFVRAGGLWSIHADPNGLESAIVNLTVNARDAMPDGGKLTIETANAYLDDPYAAAHAEVAAGQYVLIAVTDTGHGMTPEVRARAFEPFFTTKTAGAGTGLGLSQVYGFMKQSGGHVKIYSELGVGTTVKLYIPRLIDRVPQAPPNPPRPWPRPWAEASWSWWWRTTRTCAGSPSIF